ncbi:H repeat-containing Rhs element protein [Escherichia coli]|nr:H repeat-containing Rhs element protein [Escherichia coli]
MELKKLMEHISIIPDYRQAWKVEINCQASYY